MQKTIKIFYKPTTHFVLLRAEIAGLSEKKKTTTTITSTHAASEQSKQRVADQQEIVFFQPNIGPPLDCSSNQWKCFSLVDHFSTNQTLRRAFSAVPTFCSCMTGDSASEVYLRCNFPVSSFLLIAQTASCTHGAIEFAQTFWRWFEQVELGHQLSKFNPPECLFLKLHGLKG